MEMFKLPNKNFYIQLENNNWGIQKEQKFLTFNEIHNCMFILPFLEMTFEEAEKLIQDSIKEKNIEPFPLENIVKYSISENSEYWVNLGLIWIEKNIEPDSEIKELLKERIKDKILNQNIRERMKRIIRKVEKNEKIHPTTAST